MTVLFDRLLALEETTVELRTGEDVEGSPTYESPSTGVLARGKRVDKLVRTREGEDVLTSLTLWYPAVSTPVPEYGSRVTWEGSQYIVVEFKAVSAVGGGLHHTRVRCVDT